MSHKQVVLFSNDKNDLRYGIHVRLKWDHHHVKLPHSNENYTKRTYQGKDVEVLQWEIIKQELKRPIFTVDDLEAAIQVYKPYIKLTALRNFLKYQNEAIDFFAVTLKRIIELALELPSLIQTAIPILKKGENISITMTQRQAACLLANGFLCTFPTQNSESGHGRPPSINFTSLFVIEDQAAVEKLRCILNYFDRIYSKEGNKDGVITFQRKSIQNKQKREIDKIKLSQIEVSVVEHQKIEEAENMLQVDFANRWIGGGVLGNGCVQEEIRFMMSPEMIVAKLFTESLGDDEAFFMIGCERFNSYRGYSKTFRFDGNFNDETPIGKDNRRMCQVVAIDALKYSNLSEQFRDYNLRRDLFKALVGFHAEGEKIPVASGLWGCGVFQGDPIRSVLLQAMACAMNGRNLHLHIVGDVEMADKIRKTLTSISTFSVFEIYHLLEGYGDMLKGSYERSLAKFIKQEIQDINKKFSRSSKVNNQQALEAGSHKDSKSTAESGDHGCEQKKLKDALTDLKSQKYEGSNDRDKIEVKSKVQSTKSGNSAQRNDATSTSGFFPHEYPRENASKSKPTPSQHKNDESGGFKECMNHNRNEKSNEESMDIE